MVNTALSINKKVKIGMVGKYVELRDAYLSVAEALTHGGIGNEVKVDIEWIDSEEIDAGNVEAKLGHLDGVLVPGGFWTKRCRRKKLQQLSMYVLITFLSLVFA